MSRPGRLDRRVELWRDAGTTQDSFGAHIPAWTLIGSRWGEVSPGKGAERFRQDSEREKQAVLITIRYDELTATLGAADRLRYDASPVSFEYDIESVSDRGSEHRYVEVLAAHRSPESDRLPASP